MLSEMDYRDIRQSEKEYQIKKLQNQIEYHRQRLAELEQQLAKYYEGK